MKKNVMLRRIAAVGAFLAALSLAVFFYLAGDRTGEVVSFSSSIAQLFVPKTVSSYGELMFAYVGENNYLYNLDDETRPLVKQPVSQLLYASDDSVLYISSCEIDAMHQGRESVIQELQVGESGNRLHTIAEVSLEPCWSSNDEVIYYVEDLSLETLRTFEPLTSTSEVSAVFDQPVTGLRISSDGLLVTLNDGNEMLYVPLSKQLIPPGYSSQGKRITVCEQYDLVHSPDGQLFYRWQGSDEAVLISGSVLAAISYQDNEIFYIHQSERGTFLKSYIVSENVHTTLVSVPDGILPQLTASADLAFMLDDKGVVYRYDIQTQQMVPFHIIDRELAAAPVISLFDYRLMVYDLSGEDDHTFRYMLPADTAMLDEEAEALAQQVHGLPGEASEMAYAAYRTLGMCSMGTDVQRLQQVLLDKDYLSSIPNGIYDTATLWAVKVLQSDADLVESGVADKELQDRLFAEDLVLTTNRDLRVGDQGIRVSNAQARLRTLGYLNASIRGVVDQQTLDAVTLFMRDNGLVGEEGMISFQVQEALDDPGAVANSGYLQLEIGDNSPMVFRLTSRLCILGYLDGYPSPDIDNAAIQAVRLFSQVSGLTLEKGISAQTQKMIFSEDALQCPDDLGPVSREDSQPSTPGQVITDKELKVLRKWLTKSFAVNHTEKQAVKRLQKQLMRLGLLKQENVTMVFDAATADAVIQFQQGNGLVEDGIPTKKTLMAVFGVNNATLSGE